MRFRLLSQNQFGPRLALDLTMGSHTVILDPFGAVLLMGHFEGKLPLITDPCITYVTASGGKRFLATTTMCVRHTILAVCGQRLFLTGFAWRWFGSLVAYCSVALVAGWSDGLVIWHQVRMPSPVLRVAVRGQRGMVSLPRRTPSHC